jgi:hypothetical protein
VSASRAGKRAPPRARPRAAAPARWLAKLQPSRRVHRAARAPRWRAKPAAGSALRGRPRWRQSAAAVGASTAAAAAAAAAASQARPSSTSGVTLGTLALLLPSSGCAARRVSRRSSIRQCHCAHHDVWARPLSRRPPARRVRPAGLRGGWACSWCTPPAARRLGGPGACVPSQRSAAPQRKRPRRRRLGTLLRAPSLARTRPARARTRRTHTAPPRLHDGTQRRVGRGADAAAAPFWPAASPQGRTRALCGAVRGRRAAPLPAAGVLQPGACHAPPRHGARRLRRVSQTNTLALGGGGQKACGGVSADSCLWPPLRAARRTAPAAARRATGARSASGGGHGRPRRGAAAALQFRLLSRALCCFFVPRAPRRTRLPPPRRAPLRLFLAAHPAARVAPRAAAREKKGGAASGALLASCSVSARESKALSVAARVLPLPPASQRACTPDARSFAPRDTQGAAPQRCCPDRHARCVARTRLRRRRFSAKTQSCYLGETLHRTDVEAPRGTQASAKKAPARASARTPRRRKPTPRRTAGSASASRGWLARAACG